MQNMFSTFWIFSLQFTCLLGSVVEQIEGIQSSSKNDSKDQATKKKIPPKHQQQASYSVPSSLFQRPPSPHPFLVKDGKLFLTPEEPSLLKTYEWARDFKAVKSLDTLPLQALESALFSKIPSVLPGTLDEKIIEPITLSTRITIDFVKNVLMKEWFDKKRALPIRSMLTLLAKARDVLRKDSQCHRIGSVSKGFGKVTVVGDLHGQYYDLRAILKSNGFPNEGGQDSSHAYLFNGDLVDRGDMSPEVLFTVLALKVALDKCVFINQGNHENMEYANHGMWRDLILRYSLFDSTRFKPGLIAKSLVQNEHLLNMLLTDRIYGPALNIVSASLQAVYQSMPLASIIYDSIFVVHGGIYDGLLIDHIDCADKKTAAHDSDYMQLLWNDPVDDKNVKMGKSRRGASSRTFGPSVTEKFLRMNNLRLVVRSHEVALDGYEIMHNRMLVKLFSSPNYVGTTLNQGAYMNVFLTPDEKTLTNVPKCKIKLMDWCHYPVKEPISKNDDLEIEFYLPRIED